MTSSNSNLWKYFLKHNQTTLFKNEEIQYNVPVHKDIDPTENDEFQFHDQHVFGCITDMLMVVMVGYFITTKFFRFM